jgi:hypothetical protein
MQHMRQRTLICTENTFYTRDVNAEQHILSVENAWVTAPPQKRPTTEAKETYYRGKKRDLL